MDSKRFVFLLVLLAILTVALAFDHRRLRSGYEDFRAIATEAQVGLFLPTFYGETVGGEALRIARTESRPQVLWFFRSDCPYCNASLAELRNLRARLAPFEVDLFPISLDQDSALLTRFAADSLEGFRVMGLPERKLVQLYRIRAVPDARVLDRRGRILFAETGVLTAGVADSIVAVVEQWLAMADAAAADPVSSTLITEEES